MSELKAYFENTKGFGVLSTANADGVVNAAVYSRPHVMDDGSIAVVMNDRLSHKNVLATKKAHFLFPGKTPQDTRGNDFHCRCYAKRKILSCSMSSAAGAKLMKSNRPKRRFSGLLLCRQRLAAYSALQTLKRIDDHWGTPLQGSDSFDSPG